MAEKYILHIDDSPKARHDMEAMLERLACEHQLDPDAVKEATLFAHDPGSAYELMDEYSDKIIAVFADNNMGAVVGDFGVEYLTEAQKKCPQAKLYWASSCLPTKEESKQLQSAGVIYKIFAKQALTDEKIANDFYPDVMRELKEMLKDICAIKADSPRSPMDYVKPPAGDKERGVGL